MSIALMNRIKEVENRCTQLEHENGALAGRIVALEEALTAPKTPAFLNEPAKQAKQPGKAN